MYSVTCPEGLHLLTDLWVFVSKIAITLKESVFLAFTPFDIKLFPFNVLGTLSRYLLLPLVQFDAALSSESPDMSVNSSTERLSSLPKFPPSVPDELESSSLTSSLCCSPDAICNLEDFYSYFCSSCC